MPRDEPPPGPVGRQTVTPNLLARLFQIVTGVLLGLALVLWIMRPGGPFTADGAESYFLQEPLPAPAFALTSQRGEAVSASDFEATYLAVFFGYTSCPDVCPLTLSKLSRALGLMGESEARVQVIFISVDPERDTPDRLREYLESFHPSFLGLTGTEAELREVAGGFGAYFARSGEGDDYTVDHTARTYIVSPSGDIPLTFPITATPEEMARDLTLLLERPS